MNKTARSVLRASCSRTAMGALDQLMLILVPIIVFRISYGLARGRRPRPPKARQR